MSSFKLFAVVVVVLRVSQHALCVEVEVYEGQESVLLPCHSNVSGNHTVVWTSPSLFVHTRDQSGDVLNNQGRRYENRTSMRTDALESGNLSLTLRKPVINDSDNYTCTVRQSGKEQDRKEVQLTVKEPLSPSSKVLIALAVFAVLAIFGIIFWIIHCIKQRNRDAVVAAVEPVAGDEVELQVAEPPPPPVQRVGVISGRESVQLPCITTADLQDGIKVEWTDSAGKKIHVYPYQNQINGVQTEMREDLLRTRDLSLTLRYPKVEDTGTYTCTVYSRDGQPCLTQQVELQVRAQQVYVVSGAESVQLPFITTADLPEDTTVRWWRDDPEPALEVHGPDQHEDYTGRAERTEDPIRTGDLSLILRLPTGRDEGTYVCRVFNKEGTFLREKTFLLHVREGGGEEGENAPLMMDQGA